MAAKLKDNFGADAILIEGGGGEFEVTRDGALIYSKKQTGEFPNEDELIASLA